MKQVRIFISSVQKEFAVERATLRDYLRGDALMMRFFEPFLFEDVPAASRSADEVYLREVEQCDVYIGLFGDEYGFEGKGGVSPTEREFNHAGELGKPRLIYVKGQDDKDKHPKMKALIRRAGEELVRRRFADAAGLLTAVYASLVAWLGEEKMLIHGPFDAAPCQGAGLKDLDDAGMKAFIREARASRGFPLRESATGRQLLTHLNLLDGGRPTHAALLLFGRDPQKFMPAAEIKCAHFHGTEVAKPIPSYHVYRGTVFAQVDQAVDFVMSKLALRVGTRAAGTKAPVAYEIPREVVAEGVVNAVAHRDYASHGSVQVMLFSDRLEIWNPGRLPSALTLESLRQPHPSIPHNPLLAQPLYLTQYIERLGTGIGDMIFRCREAGVREPEMGIRNGFVLTIWRIKISGEIAGEIAGKTSGKNAVEILPANLGEFEEKIVKIIKDKPDVTIPEMARRLRRSDRTVETLINRLKAKEVIGRVGPRKGGTGKSWAEGVSGPLLLVSFRADPNDGVLRSRYLAHGFYVQP